MSNHINSLALTPTDPDEILRITADFNNKNSYNHDGIPLTILKSSIINICEPLSYIINRSMCTGNFPDQLKIAKVCPIFKSGDKSEIANYCPISVLTSFCKIFEKAIYIDYYLI